MDRAKGLTLGRVLKAPVVWPPEATSPLGAADVQGDSSGPRVEREGRDRRHGQATGHAIAKKTLENAQRPGSQAPRSATVKITT